MAFFTLMTRLFFILTLIALSSCSQQARWNKSLGHEISELGAYNWIIIADAAYPAPGRPEAHMILSPNEIPETLENTLQVIENSAHLRPRIYLTRESFQIDDSTAPGISFHKMEITQALHGHPNQKLSERSLESMLRHSINGNRILIIKTPTTLPYASIYIELESGYWDGDSETTLRTSTKTPSSNSESTIQ